MDTIGICSGTITKITEKMAEVEDFLSSFRGRSNLRTELWWDELNDMEAKRRLIRLCLDRSTQTTGGSLCRAHCGERVAIRSDDATPLRPDDRRGSEKDYIMQQMGLGHYTFLLDEHGEFRPDHMDVINRGKSN